MRIQALLFAEDPLFQSWLEESASTLQVTSAKAEHIDEVMDRIASVGRIDIVFFAVEAATAASRVEMIARLLEMKPDIAVVGLAHEGDSGLMLSAMRAGARDFFILNQDESNLETLLARLMKRPGAISTGSTPANQGSIFGVMAAVPYEGIAFLAAHLALACGEQTGSESRTLLLDLALPAGAANIFLNINQTYGVLDAINDGSRCDGTLVDTAFTKHKSGIYLLSLPEDMQGRPHIDGDELVALLGVLRGLFASIVISFDGHLPLGVQEGLIRTCSKTMLLTDQSILKSRHSKYLVRALRLEQCPLDNVELIVDNYRKRVGLEPENLAELLELPVMASLPASSGDTRIQSMNQGVSMFECAPKDNYCGDVRDLAGRLLGRASLRRSSLVSPGVFSKLFRK